MNLVPGKRDVRLCDSACVCVLEFMGDGAGPGVGALGMRIERSAEASSGPEVEVPWRRISVVVCVVEEGGIM